MIWRARGPRSTRSRGSPKRVSSECRRSADAGHCEPSVSLAQPLARALCAAPYILIFPPGLSSSSAPVLFIPFSSPAAAVPNQEAPAASSRLSVSWAVGNHHRPGQGEMADHRAKKRAEKKAASGAESLAPPPPALMMIVMIIMTTMMTKYRKLSRLKPACTPRHVIHHLSRLSEWIPPKEDGMAPEQPPPKRQRPSAASGATGAPDAPGQKLKSYRCHDWRRRR